MSGFVVLESSRNLILVVVLGLQQYLLLCCLEKIEKPMTEFDSWHGFPVVGYFV